MKHVDIVLSGVGGQGILTLASIMGMAAIIEGYDTKVAEVHGMAQRGGSVVCHVRIGEKVSSPLVMEGSADMIISLELSETLKVLQYLKSKRGVVVLNSNALPPPISMILDFQYPSLEAILEELKGIAGEVYVINAHEIASSIGSPQSANIVMLGSAWATGKLALSEESIMKAISRTFRKDAAKINQKAFEEGARIVKKLL
ncbi:MAG: indolepyruvate oxidoreductase subunit beta [Candidatus Nezhaarchaeales archaeon]